MHPSRQITLSSCPRIKHSRESTNRRPCALSRTGVQRITIRTRVITDLSGPARKVLGLHTPAPSPVPIQGQLLASRTVRSPCRGRILTGVTRGRFQTPRTDDFFSLVLDFFIDDSCVQGRGLKTPALQRVGYLLRIRSEREPCADLHRARRAVGNEPADRHEVRIREARVWIAPLRMVQHVRRFYPQLKPIVADRNRSEE